jgi:hypothetical protein
MPDQCTARIYRRNVVDRIKHCGISIYCSSLRPSPRYRNWQRKLILLAMGPSRHLSISILMVKFQEISFSQTPVMFYMKKSANSSPYRYLALKLPKYNTYHWHRKFSISKPSIHTQPSSDLDFSPAFLHVLAFVTANHV